jgi:hypothetical protein
MSFLYLTANGAKMDLSRLKDPFREDEIEFRLAQAGESNGKVWAHCLAYIRARAILDRLDEVCGPENWKVEYQFVSTQGVICNLSIKIGTEWVTKQDGAEMTEIESFKGGISSALKRAGSAWGIGRYLYSLETAFAQIHETKVKGANFGKTKSGKTFYWTPPELPSWAVSTENHAKDAIDANYAGEQGDVKPKPVNRPRIISPDPELVKQKKKEVVDLWSRHGTVNGMTEYIHRTWPDQGEEPLNLEQWNAIDRYISRQLNSRPPQPLDPSLNAQDDDLNIEFPPLEGEQASGM